jgi:hypothetical protein
VGGQLVYTPVGTDLLQPPKHPDMQQQVVKLADGSLASVAVPCMNYYKLSEADVRAPLPANLNSLPSEVDAASSAMSSSGSATPKARSLPMGASVHAIRSGQPVALPRTVADEAAETLALLPCATSPGASSSPG